jgi:hypothetical protein
MSLVGKFFLHFGSEYLHTGEVVAQVDPATVLMKFDKCEHVPPATGAVMIAVSSLISTVKADGSLESEWEFFDARADLDAWMEWLDTPHDDDHHADAEEAPKLN